MIEICSFVVLFLKAYLGVKMNKISYFFLALNLGILYVAAKSIGKF